MKFPLFGGHKSASLKQSFQAAPGGFAGGWVERQVVCGENQWNIGEYYWQCDAISPTGFWSLGKFRFYIDTFLQKTWKIV